MKIYAEIPEHRLPSFTPLEPPSHVCPRCLGWWANMSEPGRGSACASQGSCPASKLCERLYGDPCVVVIDETEELMDMQRVCWGWKAGEKPCLVCRHTTCPDRRMPL